MRQIKHGAGGLSGGRTSEVSMRELELRSSRRLIDALRLPVLLIDGRRTLLHANAAGVRLLSRCDPVHSLDGRVACRDAECEQALDAAFAALFHAPERSREARRTIRLRLRDGRATAGVLLALRRSREKIASVREPQAIFAISEPSLADRTDQDLIEATFRLTPAEARIAMFIAAGATPRECADRLHVGLSTVRSQLASIYRKTGTSGQPDMIRMVVSATLV
jgi:DNA-binding CsgD family transcriptional regulator